MPAKVLEVPANGHQSDYMPDIMVVSSGTVAQEYHHHQIELLDQFSTRIFW